MVGPAILCTYDLVLIGARIFQIGPCRMDAFNRFALLNLGFLDPFSKAQLLLGLGTAVMTTGPSWNWNVIWGQSWDGPLSDH